jgi:hypothetical protein
MDPSSQFQNAAFYLGATKLSSDLGNVMTGSAASLAAVLSGLSLYVNRRWQHKDLAQNRDWQLQTWLLDAAKQAVIDHINLSFRIGHNCSEASLARTRGDQITVDLLFDTANQLHVKYMDLMVYFRILSTAAVVSAAEQLHVSLDNLLDVTYEPEGLLRGRAFTKRGIPSGLSERDARAVCMDKRELLINNVRCQFGLVMDATIDRNI